MSIKINVLLYLALDRQIKIRSLKSKRRMLTSGFSTAIVNVKDKMTKEEEDWGGGGGEEEEGEGEKEEGGREGRRGEGRRSCHLTQVLYAHSIIKETDNIFRMYKNPGNTLEILLLALSKEVTGRCILANKENKEKIMAKDGEHKYI